MSIAIVMADAAGRIVYWDDGATTLFGWSADQAVGQRVDLIVPDELRDRHWEGFTRVMAGGERHLVGAAINLPVKTRDGSVLAFPARFNHLDDPQGQPIGAMAVFNDRQGDEQPWTLVSPPSTTE